MLQLRPQRGINALFFEQAGSHVRPESCDTDSTA
jgi:hypothetical protein